MRVVWLPRALHRIEQAREYVARDKTLAAAGMMRRVFECAEGLKEFPELSRAGIVSGTRQMFVYGTPFILHYRIRGDRVEILALIHGARRWPDIF